MRIIFVNFFFISFLPVVQEEMLLKIYLSSGLAPFGTVELGHLCAILVEGKITAA